MSSFEIVDAGDVDGGLPAADGLGDGVVGGAGDVAAFAAGLAGVAALHDGLDGAADADEEGGEAFEAAGAVDEHVLVVGVVADVDDDVEAEPAVGGDRLVEGGVERRDPGTAGWSGSPGRRPMPGWRRFGVT